MKYPVSKDKQAPYPQTEEKDTSHTGSGTCSEPERTTCREHVPLHRCSFLGRCERLGNVTRNLAARESMWSEGMPSPEQSERINKNDFKGELGNLIRSVFTRVT